MSEFLIISHGSPLDFLPDHLAPSFAESTTDPLGVPFAPAERNSDRAELICELDIFV